jgi:hypothetical protein
MMNISVMFTAVWGNSELSSQNQIGLFEECSITLKNKCTNSLFISSYDTFNHSCPVDGRELMYHLTESRNGSILVDHPQARFDSRLIGVTENGNNIGLDYW